MIKLKNWTLLSLLLLLLAACNPPGRGNTGPTPTSVRLDGDAPPGPAIAVAAGPTATATITAIPPPSATPISNPTPTAPPSPIDPTVTASPTAGPMAQVDDLPVIEVTETSGTGGDLVTSAARPVSQPPGNAPGSQLVFATRSGGDLVAVNIDGTGLRRLAGGVIDPVVSPDGQQVAFTRWNSGEVGTLFVINIDGSNERAILGETLQAKSPTWSPDGQSIVVSFQQGGLRNPGEECRSFDADDGIRLPDDIGQITHTSFRNGEFKICFIRREDLQWLLRQLDVAGGQFEDLPVDLYSYTPAWDPQNPWRVIYDGERGLMQLDLTTGQNSPLTTDFGDTGPVFSPDGQRLAISYKQHDHWEVYTYDLAGGTRQRLTKPPLLANPQYNSAAPVWSPDGSQLAFVTDRSGAWEIWVMNADGSAPRPLFAPEIQAQWGLDYQGVHERLLNWIGMGAAPAAGVATTPATSGPAGPASATNISLEGTWDFSFGTMTLSHKNSRVEGTYQWYGGTDTGRIEGIFVADLNQFQGLWISDRSPTSQKLLRWQVASDGQRFSGQTVGGSPGQQWCGVRSGQPLPSGCGFSGDWAVRFGSPPGTGQASLVQTGPLVQGTYTDGSGQRGQVEGVVTVHSGTEVTLAGTWRDDRGQSDSFEWRLDLTTGRTFQGRRDPGNSEWCGWRVGTAEPVPCGGQD